MNKESSSFLSLFFNDTLAIPIGHFSIAVLIVSVFLVVGKHRLGLVGVYIATIYWIFAVQRVHITNLLEKTEIGVYLFGFVGVLMACFTVAGFLRKDE